MKPLRRCAFVLALLGSMGFLDCGDTITSQRCDSDADCRLGGFCDTAAGHCVQCLQDSDCDDGRFCNGVETCQGEGRCEPGAPVACPTTCGGACSEDRRECVRYGEDEDGDGYDTMACGGSDCNDTDSGRSPGNSEVCDADDKDEDCNASTFGDRDTDHDGYVDAACCNAETSGYRWCGDDCDDGRGGVHPNLPEACDGRDNDCDGAVDEGVIATVYVDDDRDGWGRGDATQQCAGTGGYAMQDGDCDDGDPQLHPGAFRCAGSGAAIDVCGDNGRWSEDACPGGGPCVPQPDGTGVCLEGLAPACSDGADNEGDGAIDYPMDPDCASPDDDSEVPQRCGDGDDNDGDGAIDYPADPGCASPEDTNEANPSTLPACANGLDDDGDGTRDWAGGTGDPGCVAAGDGDERQADGPRCDNGLDDDGDTFVDCCSKSTGDAECISPADDNEDLPVCSNGLDDDGDGFMDYPSDAGCTATDDESERNPNGAQCDNGLDDDGDGAADYPGDVLCVGPQDNDEAM